MMPVDGIKSFHYPLMIFLSDSAVLLFTTFYTPPVYLSFLIV